MPPKTRIDVPGALHHIVIRGIERKAIFADDKDRENFFKRLSSLLQETETPCLRMSTDDQSRASARVGSEGLE